MTAGYSGKPLAAKLGITDISRVLITGSPQAFDADLALPGVPVRRRGPGPFDIVLLFCPDRQVLSRRFTAVMGDLPPAGAIWVCWPKRASGVRTDLTEGDVRAHGLSNGLVDVKIVAVDSTWSGLKFVRRTADRGPVSPTAHR